MQKASTITPLTYCTFSVCNLYQNCVSFLNEFHCIVNSFFCFFFIAIKDAADKYIERKRNILPVSYRENAKRNSRRTNGRAKADIIYKLEQQCDLKSKAIGHLQKDMQANNVIINID